MRRLIRATLLHGYGTGRRPVAGRVAGDAVRAIGEDASCRRAQSRTVGRYGRTKDADLGSRLCVESGADIPESAAFLQIQDRTAVRVEAVGVGRRRRVSDD